MWKIEVQKLSVDVLFLLRYAKFELLKPNQKVSFIVLKVVPCCICSFLLGVDL